MKWSWISIFFFNFSLLDLHNSMAQQHNDAFNKPAGTRVRQFLPFELSV
jgi:hypothetical protein